MVRSLMIVISRIGATLLAASMVSACAGPGLLLPAATETGAPTAAQLQPPTATATPTATPAPPPPSTTAPASGVRSTLDRLLGEHVLLVGFATGAALDGRADEFAAYAAALDSNSVDLASVIASVYGEPAGVAFLDLWRQHITLVVNYTQGIGSGDTAAAG